MALEEKPVALDPGVPLGTWAHGGIPRDRDLRRWLRPQRHLAMAWRRRRQRAALARPGQARPDQAIGFLNQLIIKLRIK